MEGRLGFQTHGRDSILLNARTGRLEQPRSVMDVGPQFAALAVEAIPLGEKMLERSRGGDSHLAGRSVAGSEESRRLLALRLKGLVLGDDARVTIRKPVAAASGVDQPPDWTHRG